MEDKKKLLKLSLNEISVEDDPTIVKAQFILFDFDTSFNNTVIDKQVALDAKGTVLNKPIVSRYYKVDEPGTPTDAMGSHEAQLTTDRDGDLAIEYGTEAIGVFTTEGYVTSVNTPEGEKEVFAADAVLWYSRYTDAIDLLFEWHSRGININTSVELLYQNYNVVEGLEYIQSPIYIDGHAILNSENRGDHDVVLPAYGSSKLASIEEKQEFNKLVAQAASLNTSNKGVKEDDEKVKPSELKKVFELSHDETRMKLYDFLDGKYDWAWIVEVYDGYFIFENEKWDEENEKFYYEFIKVPYTKNDEDISVDFEQAVEVEFEKNWKEKDSVVELEEQNNSLIEDLAHAENARFDADKKIATFNEKIENLETQFNSVKEENESLSEYKEKFESAQFEKALSEEKEYYSKKFNSLNKSEEFEDEDVQSLVVESAKGDSEAKLKLNSMIVDFLEDNEKPSKKQFQFTEEGKDKQNKSMGKDSFDTKYFE